MLVKCGHWQRRGHVHFWVQATGGDDLERREFPKDIANGIVMSLAPFPSFLPLVSLEHSAKRPADEKGCFCSIALHYTATVLKGLVDVVIGGFGSHKS